MSYSIRTEEQTTPNGRDGIKKMHMYVPPRIDEVWYQVDVPDVTLRTKRGISDNSSWLGSCMEICSSDLEDSEEMKDFLVEMRQIFEGNTLDSIPSMPLETDSYVFEFLSSCNNDVKLAKTRMYSLLSFGKDVVQTRFNLVPTVLSPTQIEDRFIKSQGAVFSMSGAFDSSDKSLSRIYNSLSSRSGDAYGRSLYGDVAYASAPGVESNLGDDVAINTLLEKGESDKRQRIDKQDMKKRWQELFKHALSLSERLSAVSSFSSSEDSRPHLRDLLLPLEELSQLPTYVDGPGENSMYLVNPKLREISRAAQEARTWIATVHDLLHEGYVINRSQRTDALSSAYLEMHELDRLALEFSEAKAKITTEHKGAVLAEIYKKERAGGRSQKPVEVKFPEAFKVILERTLHEGRNLSVHTDEEVVLTHLLKVFDEWNVNADGFLKSSEKVKKKKNDSTFLVTLFNQSLTLPIAIFDSKFLDILQLYKAYLQVTEEISHFLYHAAVSKHAALQKKYPSTVDLELVKFDLNDCRLSLDNMKQSTESIVIDSMKGYEDLVLRGESWVNEVMQLSDCTVSIRRVEKLLLDGEKLPFDFKQQIEILKAKRNLAKQWLEKVKTSLVRGGNRHPKRGEIDEDSKKVEKLNFDVLKQIVNEGEQFSDGISVTSLEKQQNKELNRVVSIVEAAEEWQSKLRETVSGTDGDTSTSIAELTDLLTEAENMPIVMDEISVLKAHLKLLEWGVGVKKLREENVGGHLCFKEVKDLLKELDTIYDSLEKQARTEVTATVKIAEEAYIRALHKEGQQWTNKSKDIFQGGVVKKGSSLKRLNEVYAFGISMTIDLTNELQPIKKSISEAENWIFDNEKLLIQLNFHRGTVKVLNKKGSKDDDERDKKLGIYLSGKVEILHLTKAAHTAHGISIEFEEIALFRKLYERCNKWLKDVKQICPVRQTRRIDRVKSDSKPSIACVSTLLEEMTLIGIEFPDEKLRILSMIENAEAWKSSYNDFKVSLDATLLNAVQQYHRIPIDERFPFPCIEGIPLYKVVWTDEHFENLVDCEGTQKVGDDYNDDETEENSRGVGEENSPTKEHEATSDMSELHIWNELSEIFDTLSEKLEGYEDVGVSVEGWEDLNMYSSIFQWVQSARKLLNDPDWESISKDEIINHINDVFIVVDRASFLELSSCYCTDMQLPLDTFQTLLAYVPVDEETREDDREEGRRRTDRKKANINWADRFSQGGIKKRDKNAFIKKESIVEGSVDAIDVIDSNVEDIQATEIEKEEEIIDDVEPKAKKAKKSRGSKLTEDEPLSSISFSKTKKTFESFLSSFKASEVNLNILDLLYYWLRSILFLLGRNIESSVWSEEAIALKYSKSSFAAISHRINTARTRKIPRKHRQVLDHVIAESTKWKHRAQTVLSMESNVKISLDDLAELITKGEKLVCYHETEVVALKEHMLSYTTWINKYENSGNDAKITLTDLVSEASNFVVDVSEHLEVIASNMKAYCLCRMHYHGDMIGCDCCDDWYHLSCIGLAACQLDSIENYVCIRCVITKSFNDRAILCYKITCNWMELSSVVSSHKNKQDKSKKRVALVSNQAKRLQGLLKEFESLDEGVIVEGTSPPVNSNIAHVAELQSELAEVLLKLDKLKLRDDVLKKMNDKELAQFELVKAWMLKVFSILVPEVAGNVADGHPVLSPGDLPPVLADLVIQARAQGIADIEDVETIVDSFRWMTWCFCCLYALRNPLTSNLLRLLVKTCNEIKEPDEKIIKVLSGILSKSSSWKSKVKKLLGGKGKAASTIEATKVILLYQESASIPVNTRLKGFLKSGIDKCHSKLLEKEDVSTAAALLKFYPLADPESGDKRKQKRTLAVPELEAVFVTLSASESGFSSDEDDNLDVEMLEDVVDDGSYFVRSIATKNSVQFIKYLNYQKRMVGSTVVAAADPSTIWPISSLFDIGIDSKGGIEENVGVVSSCV